MQQEPPPPPQALGDSHSPTRSSEGPSAVGRATPPGRAQDGPGGGCDLPRTPHGGAEPGLHPGTPASGPGCRSLTSGANTWEGGSLAAIQIVCENEAVKIFSPPSARRARAQINEGSVTRTGLLGEGDLGGEGTWDLRQERRGPDSRPCSVGLVDFLGAPSAVPRDQEAPGGCPPLRVLGACPGNVSGGSGVRPGHGGPCAHSGGREAPVSSEILRGEWTGWGCGTLSRVFQKVFLGPSEREGGDRSTGARSGPAWPPSHAPSGHRNFPGSLSSLVLR